VSEWTTAIQVDLELIYMHSLTKSLQKLNILLEQVSTSRVFENLYWLACSLSVLWREESFNLIVKVIVSVESDAPAKHG
jgi:hypothetical protein